MSASIPPMRHEVEGVLTQWKSGFFVWNGPHYGFVRKPPPLDHTKEGRARYL